MFCTFLGNSAHFQLQPFNGGYRRIDSGALVGGDLVLVDNPLEGRTVAEAVLEDFGRDAAKDEEAFISDLFFCLWRASSSRRAS
jgi:hypothetical protein